MTNTPAAPMTPRKALEIAEFHHQQHRDITAIQSWQDCTAWPCRAVAEARSAPTEPLDVERLNLAAYRTPEKRGESRKEWLTRVATEYARLSRPAGEQRP